MEEFKKCLFDIKSVTLHTSGLLTFDLDWEWENFENLSMNIKGWIKLELKYLVDFDIKHFEKLNKSEDKEHQIDMESLTAMEIDIYDGAKPTIRIRYAFKQPDDSGNFWRGCSGDTSSFQFENVYMDRKTKETRAYAFPMYSAGCQVYW